MLLFITNAAIFKKWVVIIGILTKIKMNCLLWTGIEQINHCDWGQAKFERIPVATHDHTWVVNLSRSKWLRLTTACEMISRRQRWTVMPKSHGFGQRFKWRILSDPFSSFRWDRVYQLERIFDHNVSHIGKMCDNDSGRILFFPLTNKVGMFFGQRRKSSCRLTSTAYHTWANKNIQLEIRSGLTNLLRKLEGCWPTDEVRVRLGRREPCGWMSHPCV